MIIIISFWKASAYYSGVINWSITQNPSSGQIINWGTCTNAHYYDSLQRGDPGYNWDIDLVFYSGYVNYYEILSARAYERGET